jgi:hypothetical protein
MEFYNNILCVSGSELIMSDNNPEGIISKPLWDKLRRTSLRVVRRACNGQTALVTLDSLPAKYKDLATEKFGRPDEAPAPKTFKDKVVADEKAVSFYSTYTLSDGRSLKPEVQREYAMNAAVLNALKQAHESMRSTRTKLGVSMNGFWKKAMDTVNEVRVELGHTLPAKQTPLQRVYSKYVTNSYTALISGKYCNDNSRKVSDKMENLFLSLYAMPNKPFAADVHTLYTMFITSKITVPCKKTGEILNPQDYYENGDPILVTSKTIWNYLNQHVNRAVVDSKRSGGHRFNNTHRPHHHRTAPNFSFSKISMDDRDLPRKCSEGIWVKAYYAYDVASGCVIGYSHSRKKDETLFLDCLRNMFRMIEREGFGMPLQVEVENHLVNKFFDDLGEMFSFVRICNPGNSQEKHAEHLNRAKKYGTEKKTQNGIGRWWGKHEAFIVDRDKVNDEFVEKVYSFEQLEADDIAAIHKFNNTLHPKQKKYPGKTRWQVLTENMNPNVEPISKALIYKCIGYHTQTSIRRNQYATVREAKYQIPSIDVLKHLTPGNHTVDAYYLPDNDGIINEVFLYQRGVRICTATKIQHYNTANAEWTSADKEAFTNQSKFVSQFDAKIKKAKNELHAPVIIESETLKQALDHVATVENSPVPEEEQDFESLLNEDTSLDDEAAAIDSL